MCLWWWCVQRSKLLAEVSNGASMPLTKLRLPPTKRPGEAWEAAGSRQSADASEAIALVAVQCCWVVVSTLKFAPDNNTNSHSTNAWVGALVYCHKFKHLCSLIHIGATEETQGKLCYRMPLENTQQTAEEVVWRMVYNAVGQQCVCYLRKALNARQQRV